MSLRIAYFAIFAQNPGLFPGRRSFPSPEPEYIRSRAAPALRNRSGQKRCAGCCKPDSVLSANGGGNHLSVRPEPGVPDAASSDSPSIWSCCGRGLPCGAALADAPGGLLPHPFTLTRIAPGGILSVALAFLRRIVRSILLFKRTPRSMQSGLSSTGTEMNPLRPRLPATGVPFLI